MRKIRIGNDVALRATLLQNGDAYTPSTGDYQVRLWHAIAGDAEIEDIAISDNVVSLTFPKSAQKYTGTYHLIYEEDGVTSDVKAFQLVAHSWQTGGDDNGAVGTDPVTVTVNIASGSSGSVSGLSIEDADDDEYPDVALEGVNDVDYPDVQL